MNAITSDTLYLILPFKVSQLSLLLADKLGISKLDAIRTIYRSKTYRDLEREETKLWHLGPVGLLDYFTQNG